MLRPPFIKMNASPKILQTINEPCPGCGCKTTYMVEARVKSRKTMEVVMLRTEDSPTVNLRMIYGSCAACHWQSQAMMTEDKEKYSDNEEGVSPVQPDDSSDTNKV